MKSLKQIFQNWQWYEIAYAVFAYVIIIITSIVGGTIISTLLVSIFGLTGTILNTKTIKYCFIFYILSAAFYIYVTFCQKYYGEMILNLCLVIPLYSLSLIKLLKKDYQEVSFQIEKMNHKMFLAIIGISTIITIVYGYILSLIGTALPYVNSASTAICASACFLASKKNIGQWIFWIINTLIQIVLWYFAIKDGDMSGLSILVLNITYLGINIYGLLTWKKRITA